MALDILLISASIALAVLTGILVAMFFKLSRGLAEMGEMLRGMQRELTPLVQDLRTISVNAAAASDSLRTGMQRVGRMTQALGNVGDDLEEGRQMVMGGVELLGLLTAPWLTKLKVFRKALFHRS
jgi:hypothetical protein